ncbi:MAG: hypothetical protein IJX87_04570 [Clostridia bacterium]|nr:hypothetical protein [Clostridia bacterium]
MAKVYTIPGNVNKKMKRKMAVWGMIFGLAMLGVAFLPVASIRDVSIGNYYEIILQAISGKTESVRYIMSYVCIAAVVLVFAFYEVINAIVSIVVCFMPAKEGVVKRNTFLDYLLAWGFGALLLVALFVVIQYVSHSYGFICYTPFIMAAIWLLSSLRKMKITNKATRDYSAVEAPKKIKRRKVISAAAFLLIGCIVVAAGGWAFFQLGGGLRAQELDGFIKKKTLIVGEWKERSENIVVDEKFGPLMLTKKTMLEAELAKDPENEELQQKVANFNENNGWTINWGDMTESGKTVQIYGVHQKYYEAKWIELKQAKEKHKQNQPTGNDQSKWDAYFNKLEQYDKDVATLESVMEAMNFQSETLYFDHIKPKEVTDEGTAAYRKHLTAYEYNAEPDLVEKWGAVYTSKLQVKYEESIALSKYVFEVGTDFRNEELIVEVHYSDGSIRIAYIRVNPDPEKEKGASALLNWEELNEAEEGIYLLKWQDAWGTYETRVNFVDKLTTTSAESSK